MGTRFIKSVSILTAAVMLFGVTPHIVYADDSSSADTAEEETKVNDRASAARDITDGSVYTESISAENKIRYYSYTLAEKSDSTGSTSSETSEDGYVRFIFTPGSKAGKYSSWVVAALDPKQKGDPQKVTKTFYSDPLSIESGQSVYFRVSRPANDLSDDISYSVKAEFAKEESSFSTPAEESSDTAASEVIADDSFGKDLERQTIKAISIHDFDKKGLTVRWRKIPGVSGYQIRYSSNKKMTSVKSASSKKAKVLLKGVGKGKSVFVKVRAFVKTDSGKKYYSKWSKVKEIKITGIVFD